MVRKLEQTLILNASTLKKEWGPGIGEWESGRGLKNHLKELLSGDNNVEPLNTFNGWLKNIIFSALYKLHFISHHFFC